MTDPASRGTGPFIAAIDQGTTSSRCIVFDRDGLVVAVDRKEHAQILPRPGWVEHDAAEIWANVREVVAGAVGKAGLTAADVKAVGITNQRETTVLWDRRTGEPVHHAIVWQDTRTDALCRELGRNVGQERFRRETGLPWPPTSPARRPAGCSTTSRACASGPSGARSSSAPWTPGSSGTSPAAPTAAGTSPT